MAHRPPRGTAATVSLGVLLAATVGTLTLGLLLKQPCASGDWADGRQYRQLCYSDIVPLYGTEHLQGGRLPFVDRCPSGGGQCDEYPVLTMYLMRLAAWSSGDGGGYRGFFYANVFLLSICALTTTWALYRMVGVRAAYFAMAPTLLIYAFVNWDLLAVVLATAGTLAFLRNRDEASGALLGLGAAAKVYPGLLVLPFALDRLRAGRRPDAIRLAIWAAATWVVVNLPFALIGREGWLTFFRFNADRSADWDSMWFVACSRLSGTAACEWSSGLVNLASLGLFVVLAAVSWLARTARQPSYARWTFGFPLLVLFLLTNKVYSPQYGLWLLPWFATALPNPWLFAAFEAADVAVFITRFSWFGRLAADLGDPAFAGYAGAPIGAFQIALAARAVILVACLVAWVLRKGDQDRPAVVPGAAPARAADTDERVR